MRYEVLKITGECHEAFDCCDRATESLLELAASAPGDAGRFEILEIADDGEVLGRFEVDAELITAASGR